MAAPLTCTDLLAVDSVPGTRSTDCTSFTSGALTSIAVATEAGLSGVPVVTGVNVVAVETDDGWKLLGLGEVADGCDSLGPEGEMAPELESVFTFRSLALPMTTLLASRFSNTSSVLS